MPSTTRFAPSPTGFLHLGHAYAARIAHDGAQEPGGHFLLRLEDIDATRCRAEFAEAIETDLAWLGLHWSGAVRHQSAHFADYKAALDRLDAAGLLYPCTCTRSDIAQSIEAPQGPMGPLYPGTCRARSLDEQKAIRTGALPFVLRLDVEKAMSRIAAPLTFRNNGGTVEAAPQALGDVVLARKDFPASYHLSVTVDDALQGVTLVTRGEDLFPATHIHRLLQALLDYPVPDYLHHKLICDETGRRLAKRDRDKTIASLRESGATPGDVWNMIGL